MHRMPFAAALAAALLYPTWAFAAPRPISMREAIDLALERNAEVQTSVAEVAAARARLAGASALFPTNPEINIAAGPRHGASWGETDMGVDVGQRIEIAGQRGLRVAAGEAAVGAAEGRLRARRSQIAADVRDAFVRVLATGEQLKLATSAADLAKSALAAADERKRVGAASQIETNTARVELGRALREQLAAQRRNAAALGELRLLLGVDPSEQLEPQGPLAVPAPREKVNPASLLEEALAKRADLRAAREEVAAAQAERSLASRELVPSPRLGVSVRREEEATILQGTIGIDLPLFNRNQTARGTAAAREQQAQIALAALQRRVAQEVDLAFGRYQVAAGATAVYQGEVLGASEQNLALVTEAYRAGKIDFLQLVVLRRSAVDARLGFTEAVEELNAADAQLDRVLGRIP
jgi:cobalt-zinc-cadmium efflux system outer membrane protein